MARPAGFEPATSRFVVCHSIQLSYGRTSRIRRELEYSTARRAMANTIIPGEPLRHKADYLPTKPAVKRAAGPTKLAEREGFEPSLERKPH